MGHDGRPAYEQPDWANVVGGTNLVHNGKMAEQLSHYAANQ